MPLIWLALCALGCAGESGNESTGDGPDAPAGDSAEPTAPVAEPEFPAELLPENLLDRVPTTLALPLPRHLRSADDHHAAVSGDRFHPRLS